MIAKTIRYEGLATFETVSDSHEVLLPFADYEVEDMQMPEPDVGIFGGWVVVLAEGFDGRLVISGRELDAFQSEFYDPPGAA